MEKYFYEKLNLDNLIVNQKNDKKYKINNVNITNTKYKNDILICKYFINTAKRILIVIHRLYFYTNVIFIF